MTAIIETICKCPHAIIDELWYSATFANMRGVLAKLSVTHSKLENEWYFEVGFPTDENYTMFFSSFSQFGKQMSKIISAKKWLQTLSKIAVNNYNCEKQSQKIKLGAKYRSTFSQIY